MDWRTRRQRVIDFARTISPSRPVETFVRWQAVTDYHSFIGDGEGRPSISNHLYRMAVTLPVVRARVS